MSSIQLLSFTFGEEKEHLPSKIRKKERTETY